MSDTAAPDAAPKGSAPWLVKRIRKHIAEEQFAEAAELLDRPKLDEPTRLKLRTALAKAQGQWRVVQQLMEQAIARAGPTADLLTTLAQSRLRQHDPAAAAALIEQALALDPDHHQAVQIGSRIAFERADVDGALHYAREAVRLNPADTRSALQSVRLLNTIGEVQRSLDDYQAVRARDPDNPLVRVFGFRYFAHDPIELRDVVAPPAADGGGSVAARSVAVSVQKELDRLRTMIRAAPDDGHLRRGLVGYETMQEFAVAEAPGAPATAIMFTGFQDQMMGMPVSIFDRYMAALNFSAIYLKDYRRLFYLGGVASLADDYAGTLAALRDLVARLGSPRLFTIGASAGGMPAIRYGVDLGAQAAISFGGRSLAGDSLHPPNEPHDWWGGMIDGRLQRSGLEQMADLRAFLADRPRTTHIDALFGADMALDAAHASHIGDFPNVTLHPISGLATHNVIEHLVETTDFLALLRDLLPLHEGPNAAGDRS